MDGSFATSFSLAGESDNRLGLLSALEERSVLNSTESRHVAALLADTNDFLDQIIGKLGLATEDRLATTYASIFSLPYHEVTPDRLLSNEVAITFSKKLNRQFLYKNRIVPLAELDGKIITAIVDPSDTTAINGIAFALKKAIAPIIVTASELDRLLNNLFPEHSADESLISHSDLSADIGHLKDMASSEPTVRYVNRLISQASRQRASDIHIEPLARSAKIRFRIDGVLCPFDSISPSKSLSVISRLKILADLDIAERRRPQDGRMTYPVEGRAIDIRLSTTPTVNGESLVIRLLDQSRAPLDLNGLGFSESDCSQLKNWITAPNGIILLTGPTGSGKTTTLYALLSLLSKGERKILTIEDPVEYRLAGINQTQVNPTIGLTFASALRSFLRHDPDIIMVGEMRDAETAKIAVRAAMTGHLVLSTLHTNDAASAITRLLDMGVEDYLISATLLGVVGQRLIRRTCQSCNDESVTSEVHQTPCSTCHGSGFSGRIVISETLEIDEAIRPQIIKGAQSTSILEAAKAQDFVSMYKDGSAKAQNRLTTIDEVSRAVNI